MKNEGAIPYELTPTDNHWPNFVELAQKLIAIFPESGVNRESSDEYLKALILKMENLNAPESVIEQYKSWVGELADIYIRFDKNKEEYLLARYMPEEYFRINCPSELYWVIEKIESLGFKAEIFT